MHKTKKTIINLPDADIELYEFFFDSKVADNYFNYLSKNINWKQESMNLYGKDINYARLMAWYGEEGKLYRFSGKTQNPNNWNQFANPLNIPKSNSIVTMRNKVSN